MKAVVFQAFGDPDVFTYEDVADPTPRADDVVIKVGACGVNRYDLYLRMGAIFSDIAFPHILGADVAGTIASVGSGVTSWREGDRVIAAPGYPIDPADWDFTPINQAPSFEVTGTHRWGGNAEYICVPARFVLRDDTGLSTEEVAAMPLVLMTAVHAVENLGEVSNDQRVLVQAGASGSGNACVQVARALGARVATTVGSEAKIDIAKAAGAELVLNYNECDFAQELLNWTDGRGVDVVIDNVGASVFENNLKALRVGGTLVNFGLVGGYKTSFDMKDFFFRQHQMRGSFMGTIEELARGLDLLREGRVRPFVDKTFKLEDAAKAHRYIDSRAVRGKVVLIP